MKRTITMTIDSARLKSWRDHGRSPKDVAVVEMLVLLLEGGNPLDKYGVELREETTAQVRDRAVQQDPHALNDAASRLRNTIVAAGGSRADLRTNDVLLVADAVLAMRDLRCVGYQVDFGDRWYPHLFDRDVANALGQENRQVRPVFSRRMAEEG